MIKIHRLVAGLSALALATLTQSAFAEKITENLELSGFARVIGGYLDHDERQFEGYTNEVSFAEQSLVAVQPTYHFTDKFSVTSQVLAHSSSDRDSGVEWLYLSYQPDNAWHFRAGKLRTPFFIYSDSLDVGYTYPWVSAPAQVYNNYLFSTFNGARGSYFYSGSELALNLEAYYGHFKGDLFLAGTKVDVEAEVDDLAGLVATLSHNNLSLRMSYHQGHNDTVIPAVELIKQPLRANGFNDSADSLKSSGRVYALQASLSYDRVNSFYKAEWVKTVTGYKMAPEVIGFYLLGGYIIDDWTLYGTYSKSAYSEIHPANELPQTPTGNDSLDMLSAAYYQVFADTPNGSLESYILGARWDFRLDMALKAEATLFEESRNPSGFFTDSDNEDNENAMLYQVAWEWIF